ncbi:uncharacterized protein BXZ73DRAFT_101960 [Epithele typhae]|uniref:uncharacterized protein n=1 Tax=Epithele typhae TaxID=378194 RepID=UPI0020076869|nr:uncharacterized protein BXZ73DRAFT_101960 [Epithele typhae]KAH9929897.1 hypothetical protein BXZ73DRAFT_101960 [Epithele typhae]
MSVSVVLVSTIPVVVDKIGVDLHGDLAGLQPYRPKLDVRSVQDHDRTHTAWAYRARMCTALALAGNRCVSLQENRSAWVWYLEGGTGTERDTLHHEHCRWERRMERVTSRWHQLWCLQHPGSLGRLHITSASDPSTPLDFYGGFPDDGAPSDHDGVPTATLRPKLLLQSSSAVKASLAMSRAQPTPAEPSCPILTPPTIAALFSARLDIRTVTSSEAGSLYGSSRLRPLAGPSSSLGGFRAQLKALSVPPSPKKDARWSTTLTRVREGRAIVGSDTGLIIGYPAFKAW